MTVMKTSGMTLALILALVCIITKIKARSSFDDGNIYIHIHENVANNREDDDETSAEKFV